MYHTGTVPVPYLFIPWVENGKCHWRKPFHFLLLTGQGFFKSVFHKYSNDNNTIFPIKRTTLSADRRSKTTRILYTYIYTFLIEFNFFLICFFLRFGCTRSRKCAPLGRVPIKKNLNK